MPLFLLLSLVPPLIHFAVSGGVTFLSKENPTELGLSFFGDANGLRQGSFTKL